MGFGAASASGKEVHDEIFCDEKTRTFYRKTNRAGGIEGGMSNGEEIVLRVAMKPIPTLMKGLQTVDISTKKSAVAASERSDVWRDFRARNHRGSRRCGSLGRNGGRTVGRRYHGRGERKIFPPALNIF